MSMPPKDDSSVPSKIYELYHRMQAISKIDKHNMSKTKSIIPSVAFEENFIKRERLRKQEAKREIDKMRSELPEYTLNDIRIFKLPFHEALMLQLQEDGYANTEAYLQQLFELDDQLREEAGPHSIAWTRPELKNSSNELKKLSDALIKAEDEHKKGNYRQETEIFLRVAIDLAFGEENWFWLAQELILQAINNARNFSVTGKHEAMSRYIYGKVLFEMVKDYEKAEEQLDIALILSKGKSWNVKGFLPEQTSNTLYMNANYLLHLCYIRQAKSYVKTDVHKALEYAILARKCAVEACFHDGETTALYIKGQCELNIGSTKEAVSTFNKAFYIQSKLKSEKGMCEARVELSKAYLMNGSTRLALNTLLALKTQAEEHGFQFYLAQAFRYLGEYYLTCGEPGKATPLLSDALTIFHSIGNMVEADQVRNLGALSSGLELMPLYIPLLQRTDKRCADWFDNLIKLVKWKDSREPFWVERCGRVSGFDILSRDMNTNWESYKLADEDDDSINRFSMLAELASIVPSKGPSAETDSRYTSASATLEEEDRPDVIEGETLEIIEE